MIRVFVSSTFLDMQEERNALAVTVFPELRKFARERGQEFVEVDLRWGITKEEADSGQTLRLCLEEIYKSNNTSPLFFIGLLGYRYGWIPKDIEENIKRSLYEDARFRKLLEKYPVENTGITELEIRYGVLENPNFKREGSNKIAFFYVRDRESSEERFRSLNIEQSPEDFERAERLIQEIKNLAEEHKGRVIVREYKDINQLMELVKNDLQDAIEKLYPKEELDETTRERQLHQLYAKSRLKAYVPEVDALESLNGFTERSKSGYVLIKGKSGIGKSSFLAYFAEEKRKEDKEALIIEHYTTAHRNASYYENILRRFIDELESFLGIQKDKGNDLLESMWAKSSEKRNIEEKLKDRFMELLSKVATERKVYIILDGVDLIEPKVKSNLIWLLDMVFEGVYVLLSMRSDTDELSYIENYKNPFVIELKGLQTPEDKEKAIEDFYKPYGKKLEREYRKMIAKSDKTSIPLFLKSLLEELRIYGDYNTLGERIKELINLKEEDDIFEKVFERCEKDYGDYVRDILCLIALSKDGLTEPELLVLLKDKQVNRAQLSTFFYALENYFIEIQGRLKPAHSQIGKAIGDRYLTSDKVVAEYRERIISVFDEYIKQTDYVGIGRAYGELMYQVYNLKDYRKLFEYISQEKALIYLLEQDTYNFSDYVKALKYENLIEEWFDRVLEFENTRILDLVETLLLYSSKDEAIFLFTKKAKQVKELYEQDKQKWAGDYASVLYNLGFAYDMQGDISKTIKLYEKSLAIYEELYKQNKQRWAESYAWLLDNLGSVYYGKKDIDKAINYYEKSLAIFEELYKQDKQERAEVYEMLLESLADTYYEKGDIDKAIKLYEKSLAILEELYEQDKQTWAVYYAMSLRNTGTAYYKNGNIDKAIDYYEQSLTVLEDIIGYYLSIYGNPPTITVSFTVAIATNIIDTINRKDLLSKFPNITEILAKNNSEEQ